MKKTLTMALLGTMLLAGCGLAPDEPAAPAPDVAQADRATLLRDFFKASASIKTEPEFRAFVRAYPNIEAVREALAREVGPSHGGARTKAQCDRIFAAYVEALLTDNTTLMNAMADSYFRNGCG